MNIVLIIPARYSSSRFEGKPLADLCGKPMIWWTYNQAKNVNGVSSVLVATDDLRILEKCKSLNMDCELTSESHKTSTERVFEVAQRHKADLYVVVNGDEPLIDPKVIESVIPTEVKKDKPQVYNLMTKITDPVQAVDPANIKVVTDKNGYALLFSRSLIPFPKSSINYCFYKHVGVLAYTFGALEFFVNSKKWPLETIEDVNELRFIENGIPVKMINVDSDSLSVDTPKDLEYIKNKILNK